MSKVPPFPGPIKEKPSDVQKKCKHKKSSLWSLYGGVSEQCNDCGKWLR